MTKRRITYWGLLPDGRRVSFAPVEGGIPLTHIGCVQYTNGTETYWHFHFYGDHDAAKRGVVAMTGQRRTFFDRNGLMEYLPEMRTAILPAYFLTKEKKQ